MIIGSALILPDLAGLGIGGFRVDLKHSREEIATLRQEVNAQARASSTSILALGNDALSLAGAFMPGALEAASSQAGGSAVPWPPSGSGAQPTQSTGRPDRT
jgi:hypothetical protein